MKLYGHQVEAIEFLKKRSNALLADEMGLGKTLATLSALSPGEPAIVVCPAVCKGVWAKEAERVGLRADILSGRGSFRAPSPGEILVTNYDVLPDPPPPPKKVSRVVHGEQVGGHLDQSFFRHLAMSVFRNPGASRGMTVEAAAPSAIEAAPSPPEPYGFHARTTLILDECHVLRGKKTRASRTIRAMREEIGRVCGRTWGLSATPMLNTPAELFAVADALGIAEETFGSWKRFLWLFGGRYDERARKYVWGEMEALVPSLLPRTILRRLRKDVVDLPEKTHESIAIDVGASVARDLDEIEKLLEGSDGSVFTAEDLERALSSPATAGPISTVRAEAARAKIPAMIEFVENYEDAGEPLVVFSAYRAPVEALASRPGWAVVTGEVTGRKRDAAVESFQRGDLRGIALTTAAGGVGITLTRAAHALFVDRTWVPMLDVQAEDRLHRIGQRRAVTIHTLVSDHPVERRVEEIVAMKRALFERTFAGGAS